MQAVRRSGAALWGLALAGSISIGGNDGGAIPPNLDPRTLLTVQWQLSSRAGATDGGACSANFTVENVKFY